MTFTRMWVMLLATSVAWISTTPVTTTDAQVGYTANERVTPYTGRFRPGVNLDYVPPWNNFELGDIAAGNKDKGIPGIGALTTRPGLQDLVLGVYGYDVSVDAFQYYEELGMTELTAIVGFPADDNRDYNNSPCYKQQKFNALFEGIYEPIWDGGKNGTPYDDNNKFAKYMYETVSVYKDYVRFWEIWNEPGLFKGKDAQVFWGQPDYPGSWWKNDPDPCDYSIHAPIESFVRTMRIAYEVVKTVAPDDYVVLAGVGSNSFLDAVMRNTDEPGSGKVTGEFPRMGGAYFDVLGFHAYPHIDGSVRSGSGNFSERHSDGAADGVVNRRLASYQEVLYKYGYDGSKYPRKEHIITELAVPRKQFSDRFMGSEDLQINFMPKVLIKAKTSNIHAMQVYAIGDKVESYKADDEFDVMGMYEYLPGDKPGTQQVNEVGKSYKTASDLIFPTDYDANRTRAMNAPDGVRAHAFKRNDGTYLYVLWAETTTDLSERASATYKFPSSLVNGNLTRYAWDWGYTNRTSTVSAGQTINLTGRPAYFTAAGSVVTPPTNEAPEVTLTTASSSVPDANFTVSANWTESVSGLSPSDFVLRNARVTRVSGSGANYTLTVDPNGAGEVRISLPANRAVDSKGLGNKASNELRVNVEADEVDPPTNTTGIDLSLDIEGDSEDVDRYDFVTYTLKLKNSGKARATGVEVSFPKPADYAYTSASTSQGNYSDFNGRWRVGNVGAGETVTLQVTLFTLTDAERLAYAQVRSANEVDPDSRPGNGNGKSAREDDEATTITNAVGGSTGSGNTGGSGTSSGADLELAIVSDVTKVDRYDYVTFTLTLKNTGNASADGVEVAFPKPDDYAFAGRTASQGSYADFNGRWKVGRVKAGASATLSVRLFTLTGDVRTAYTQVSKASGNDPDSDPGNGNGTSAREDDEALVRINASGSSTGGGSGTGGNQGATPTAGVDLSVDISSSLSRYDRYASLPLEVTVTNSGTVDATDVIVHVPFPSEFVWSADDASTGKFTPFTQDWKIDRVKAGSTETIDLTYFALRSTGDAVCFAQVTAQRGGDDVDSSPNNARGTTVREDDEAVVTVKPLGSSAREGETNTASLIVNEVRPAEFSGVQYITFTTTMGASADATLLDALGRPVQSFKLEGADGTHRVELSTQNLPQGTYYLMVSGVDTAEAFPVQVQ